MPRSCSPTPAGARRAGRWRGSPTLTCWGSRYPPRFLRRAIGFRAARRCLRDIFAVGLSREGAVTTARVRHDLAVRATPDGFACGFYGAGIAELLRQLLSFDGAVVHPRCRVRGDEHCEWRTTDAPARVA